jgi:predicted DNA-binding transcriptional regulator AlpA
MVTGAMVAEMKQSALIGMKMICDCMDRSEATVLKLIRDEGFPAVKIGGIWESDRGEVDNWRREKIRGRRDNQ